jgi:sulfate/thiosulfate transport system substrate-binding protein
VRKVDKATRQRSAPLALVAAFTALIAAVVAGCGGGGDSATGANGGGNVDIVAYSTPEAVYTDSLGASGDQRRAVEAGQPASIVHFAQGGDMIALEEAGQVAPSWDQNKYKGIGQESVVVLAVREGNPEGLESFDDLLTEDLEIITPNPLSSGGARWNIMAIYGSQLHQGKSEQQALDAVRTVLEKTIVQPGSARDALAAFTQGEGDVLLAYENEAIKAEEEGEDIEYVVPPSTIRIETPIAVVKDAPDAAQSFLDFIWSDEGQRICRTTATAPSTRRCSTSRSSPSPRTSSTSPSSAAGKPSPTSSSTRKAARSQRSTKTSGSPRSNAWRPAPQPSRGRGQASACPRPAPASAAA